MRRLLTFSGVLVVVGLLLIPAAAAEKPDSVVHHAPGPVDFVIDNVCAFDVHVQGTFGDSEVNWPDHAIQVGHADVELTNVSDPSKSIHLKLSSLGRITSTPDGGAVITFDGPHFLAHEANEPPGSPAEMVLTRGQATWTFDANGELVAETLPNDTTDLCAALA